MAKRPLPKRKARPDFDRSMVEVLKAIRDLSPTEVSRMSKGGVAASTVRKWRLGWQNGGARFPQAYTLNEAAKAIGGRFGFIAPDQSDEVVERKPVPINGLSARH